MVAANGVIITVATSYSLGDLADRFCLAWPILPRGKQVEIIGFAICHLEAQSVDTTDLVLCFRISEIFI